MSLKGVVSMKFLIILLWTLSFQVQARKSFIVPYTAENFSTLVAKKKDFAVYFYATWCPKCRVQKNLIDKYLKSKKEVKEILLADYDSEITLRKKYKVFVQGTMLHFVKGKEVAADRLIAEVDTDKIKYFLDKISK